MYLQSNVEIKKLKSSTKGEFAKQLAIPLHWCDYYLRVRSGQTDNYGTDVVLRTYFKFTKKINRKINAND